MSMHALPLMSPSVHGQVERHLQGADDVQPFGTQISFICEQWRSHGATLPKGAAVAAKHQGYSMSCCLP